MFANDENKEFTCMSLWNAQTCTRT